MYRAIGNAGKVRVDPIPNEREEAMTIRGLISTPPVMNRHPLTGLPIEPVGVVGNKVIWPIMGGAPDPDDEDDEEAKAEAERKAKEEADAKAAADGKDDDDTEGKGSEDSARQLEEALRRMKAADKRADAAEAKIKERERAEQDEVTRLKSDLEERDSKIKDLTATVAKLTLDNAFVTANKVKWHDPDTALGLAQSGGYLDDVIDDEGVVNKKALGSALDRLAKDKPFLVKSSDDKDGKDDKPGGPSGEPAGSRSDNAKDEKAKKQQLRRRFPVLNQR